MTRYLIFLSLLLSGCISQKDSLATPPLNTLAELNAYLETSFAASGIPGVSFVVVGENGELYKKSLGHADIAGKRIYDEHTIQPIASVSKTMIAVALMKAIEQGHLSLDDEINTYLPFSVSHPNHPDKPILVRHLTTHSSGIEDTETYAHAYYFMDGKDLDKDALDPFCQYFYDIISNNERVDESYLLEQILSPSGKYFDAKAFDKEAPGTHSRYSNVAATLAAYVIERAVGISYESYTRREIFQPLGMTETFWEPDSVPANQLASLYFTKDRPVPPYQLLTRADGGLMTSTSDLGKFAREMLRGYQGGGTLLSNNSYSTMFSRQIELRKDYYMGIFWELGNEKEGFRHDGSDPGITTGLSYNASKKRAMVMFCNLDATKEGHPKIMNLWQAVGRFDFHALGAKVAGE